jgi:ketosteroid isomerase-like protein
MNESEKANLIAAHSLYEGMSNRDWGRLPQILHEDVTWTIVAKSIPGGSVYKGRTNVIDDFLWPASERFLPGSPQIRILRSFVGGDDVAVETFTSGHLRTGGQYNNNYAWFLKFKDGKIFDVREYLDTQSAAAQLG